MSSAYKSFLCEIAWDALPLVPPTPFSARTHRAFQVITPEGAEGLFTGYYEPELRGAFTRDARFRFPLYRLPDDLIAIPNVEGSNQPGLYAYGVAHAQGVTPFFTRAEIECGALRGKDCELLFVDDAVDLFFLHIQGSGCILLPDGKRQRVSFAGKNGHPYTAISRVLLDEGLLKPPVTMASIKAWLRENTAQAQDIMNRNASFIFFRLLEGAGPVGASGAVLEAEKSLAVDDTLYPYGLPVIVETRDPLDPEKPFVRLMVTADTGSAIRGPIRGDIYFGTGEAAGARAGAMKARGRLFVLEAR